MIQTSSATAYGAFPDNPKPIAEDWPVRGAPDFSYAKHKADSDRIAQLWALENPDAVMTIVRPSIVFGPSVDNYIVRAFDNNPFIPILDGVDEEFQLVHEDDVVSALIALLDGKHAGAFNLAGDGLLTWGRAAEMVGKKTRNISLKSMKRFNGALWKLHVPRTEAPAGNLDFIRYPLGGLHREAEVDGRLAAEVRHPRDLQDHHAGQGHPARVARPPCRRRRRPSRSARVLQGVAAAARSLVRTREAISGRYLLGIAAASIAFAALLVVTRGRPSVGLDNGIFLTVAGRLVHGDRLYVDVLDNKDPLFFYTQAAALWVGDWRFPFLLDVVWVALAAASLLLLLQAVGANRLTAWAGFACLPLLLTGKWYWAGYSMLAALSFNAADWNNCSGCVVASRSLGHCSAWGLLFKINVALVMVSAPVAFLLLRTPPGNARSQVARAAGGFGIVAAIAAAVMAIRGELHGYINTMVDNLSYSSRVLGATGRLTGIPGHIKEAARYVGSPPHFAVVALIFLLAGLLAIRALRGGAASDEESREPTALRPLSALFLVTTVTTSVTLALTAAWVDHEADVGGSGRAADRLSGDVGNNVIPDARNDHRRRNGSLGVSPLGRRRRRVSGRSRIDLLHLGVDGT